MLLAQISAMDVFKVIKEMSHRPIDLNEFLSTCVCFAECSDEAYDLFWEKWNNTIPCVWEGMGFMRQIGTIGKPKRRRAVTVFFRFAKFYDQRVCFFTPSSVYVNWNMVNDYIGKIAKKHTVDGVRRPKIDLNQVTHFCKCIAGRQQLKNEQTTKATV